MFDDGHITAKAIDKKVAFAYRSFIILQHFNVGTKTSS
jgi:hypothetical protein